MATKKVKLTKPIGACDFCWQYHDAGHPDTATYGEPNVIFVTDRLYENTTADRFLVRLAEKLGAVPIYTSARVCPITGTLTVDEIKRVRELSFQPLLECHSELPIVVFGEFAAKLVVGGNPSDTSMVNRCVDLGTQIASFTYTPEYYFDNNRNVEVLNNITTTIRSALMPVETPVSIVHRAPFGKSLKKIVIDVETTKAEFPYAGNSKLLLLGVMPLGKPPYILRKDELTERIKREFADNVELCIGHNIMFDLIHLAHIGITFPKARIHDTMIYHKNLFPNEPGYGLKYLAKKYGKFPHWDAWFSTRMHQKDKTIPEEDYGKLINYNAYDLFATEFLYQQQLKPYTIFTLEMDYLKYVFQMIQNGMYVDINELNEHIAGLNAEIEKYDSTFREEFGLGVDFNLNSPAQVLSYLKRDFPRIPDTNAGTLQKYEEGYPFISRLLELRGLVKLKGTSLEGLKEYIDSDHLVHTSFSVHGAETGRSSSSSPNLQNTDPRVRPHFKSRYDQGKLVHTDLAGIEYRLIGHASQDKELLYTFNAGIDIHDRTYERLWGIPPPDKVERKKAKTCNFLGVYGGGYKKFLIASELPDTPESKKLYKQVSGLYPGVEKWRANVISNLRRTHRIVNLFGRVRHFDYVDMDIEREAVNWIIQSSGHDVLKIYSMEMYDRIQGAGLHRSLLISEVHDSNTYDCPLDEYEQVHEIISSLGANLSPLIEEVYGVKMRVPILAEVEIMSRWA